MALIDRGDKNEQPIIGGKLEYLPGPDVFSKPRPIEAVWGC